MGGTFSKLSKKTLKTNRFENKAGRKELGEGWKHKDVVKAN